MRVNGLQPRAGAFRCIAVRQALFADLLWWLLALICASAACLLPWVQVGDYLFAIQLFGLVFGAITLSRLIFFPGQAPWLKPLVVKGVVCLLCILIFIGAAYAINIVQTFLDAYGTEAIFPTVQTPQALVWAEGLRTQFVFFGAANMIGAIILPIVLLIQVWKQVKRRQFEQHQQQRRRVFD